MRKIVSIVGILVAFPMCLSTVAFAYDIKPGMECTRYANVISGSGNLGSGEHYDPTAFGAYNFYSVNNFHFGSGPPDYKWVWVGNIGNFHIWDLGVGHSSSRVRVYASQDHGPFPREWWEYEVDGSNDQTTWIPGTRVKTYDITWDVDDSHIVGEGTTDWEFGASYRYFRTIARGDSADGDYEIDALGIPAEGEIPTLTEWGMIIFCVLLFGWMAWVIVRRRRRVTVGV